MFSTVHLWKTSNYGIKKKHALALAQGALVHRVLTGCFSAQGAHRVLTGCSQGALVHRVLTGCFSAQGALVHRVLTGCSQGAHRVL